VTFRHELPREPVPLAVEVEALVSLAGSDPARVTLDSVRGPDGRIKPEALSPEETRSLQNMAILYATEGEAPDYDDESEADDEDNGLERPVEPWEK